MSWGPNANNPDNRVLRYPRDYYPIGPLLYICGHMCAVGTELYGCKPGEKPVLSDLARKDVNEVEWPCGECRDSQAWVVDKEVRKWVANKNFVGSVARAPAAAVVGAASSVVRAASVVAGASAAVAGASAAVAGAPVVTAAPVAGAPAPVVATAPQQQQQLEKHMQLAREIEQLELEKKWLEEELQKVSSSSSK